MSIIRNIVRGASTQFGREFGRAGANAVLKGSNHYTLKGSGFEGRIKPSDSRLVRCYKEVDKISRLIEMTDKVLELIEFKGQESLSTIDEMQALLSLFERKFEHGTSLISDDYSEKSSELLAARRKELEERFVRFNAQLTSYVKTSLSQAMAKRKMKIPATILACPPLGSFGLHHFYLGKIGLGVVSLLLFWTVIVPFFNLLYFFKLLFSSQEKLDDEFNPDYAYFSSIRIGGE